MRAGIRHMERFDLFAPGKKRLEQISGGSPSDPALVAFPSLRSNHVTQRNLEELLMPPLREDKASFPRSVGTLRSSGAAAKAIHGACLKRGSNPTVGEVRQLDAYFDKMTIDLAPNREQTGTVRNGLISALQALDRLSAQRRAIFLARWTPPIGCIKDTPTSLAPRAVCQ